MNDSSRSIASVALADRDLCRHSVSGAPDSAHDFRCGTAVDPHRPGLPFGHGLELSGETLARLGGERLP